jgi:predicted transcriptional regulator
VAQRGRPLDVATIRQLLRAAQTMSLSAAARLARVDRKTARKYLRGAR